MRDAVPDAHVLVVDDGSPDGTGKIADELAGADQRVHVLHRAEKAGLGTAYIAGFDWGLERGYDVARRDGRGRIARARAAAAAAGAPLDEADLVLGSRWVPGGAVVNWPRAGCCISRGGNVYVRMALGLRLRDATGGYRAYRLEALESLGSPTSPRRATASRSTWSGAPSPAGFRVVEVPITFVERERGESKMSSDIVREAFVRVGRWGARQRSDQVRAAIRRRRAK